MAYIDYTYYTTTFGGSEIPASDFGRLADIASDLICAISTEEPSGSILTDETFMKACAYQVEFLHDQGGIDAIMGRSDASQSGGSEHLGNYSVSAGSSKKSGLKFYNGIPVSPMTIMLLEKIGLLTRWLYAYRYREATNGFA